MSNEKTKLSRGGVVIEVMKCASLVIMGTVFGMLYGRTLQVLTRSDEQEAKLKSLPPAVQSECRDGAQKAAQALIEYRKALTALIGRSEETQDPMSDINHFMRTCLKERLKKDAGPQ